MDTNPDSACEEDSLPSEVSDPVNIQTNSKGKGKAVPLQAWSVPGS